MLTKQTTRASRMYRIKRTESPTQISVSELSSWAKTGKYLISTFKPDPSHDPFCITATKIISIIIGGLVSLFFAIPTLGLSLALPLYCLYKGTRKLPILEHPLRSLPHSSPFHPQRIKEQSNLKNRECDKEAPQILHPQQADVYIHTAQGADAKSEVKPISSKTDSSDSFGIVRRSPIGIHNAGNDCYFNSAMQGIMNIPALLEIACELGEDEDYSPYKKIIEDYLQCQEGNGIMQTGQHSGYRKFREYLHTKYEIFPEGIQADAGQVLVCIFKDIIEHYGRGICKNKNISFDSLFEKTTIEPSQDYVSKAIKIIMEDTTFSKIAYDLGEEGLYIYKTLVANYKNCKKTKSSMDTVCKDFRRDMNASHHPMFPPDEERSTWKLIECFKRDVLCHYGQSVLKEKNTIQFLPLVSDDSTDYTTAFKQLHSFEKLPPPENFIFSENRKLHLLPNCPSLIVNDKSYQCTYFNVHTGGISSGHYHCYLNVNNQWHKINDSYVDKVDDIDAEIQALGNQSNVRNIYFTRKQNNT